MSSIFADQNVILVAMKNRRNGKFTDVWKLNNMLLNNQWIKDEIKREILKKTLRQMKTEIQYGKSYEIQQKQFWEGRL